jgi:hypothetical protein
VGIKGKIDYQITPCQLKGIVVSNRQELIMKTIGCERYIIEHGLLEGCRWQAKPPKNL